MCCRERHDPIDPVSWSRATTRRAVTTTSTAELAGRLSRRTTTTLGAVRSFPPPAAQRRFYPIALPTMRLPQLGEVVRLRQGARRGCKRKRHQGRAPHLHEGAGVYGLDQRRPGCDWPGLRPKVHQRDAECAVQPPPHGASRAYHPLLFYHAALMRALQ